MKKLQQLTVGNLPAKKVLPACERPGARRINSCVSCTQKRGYILILLPCIIYLLSANCKKLHLVMGHRFLRIDHQQEKQ